MLQDLQSQKYIKALDTNDPGCFAIRFKRNDLERSPILLDHAPKDCWDDMTDSLNLPLPHSYGGVLIGTSDGRAVLVGVRVSLKQMQGRRTPRSLCAMVFLELGCEIEAHLVSLTKGRCPDTVRPVSIQLNDGQRLHARLEHDALEIWIEGEAVGHYSPGSSPPSTPEASIRSPSSRRVSFAVPDTQTSALQLRRHSLPPTEDARSKDKWPGTKFDRSPMCPNCRAQEEEEIARKRRRIQQRRERRENMARREVGAAGVTFISALAQPSRDSDSDD
jgi:hypothetical protein